MTEEQKTFMIEDAHILFRNFAGREEQFNDKGKRNFCVILEPDVAKQMEADDWNVKYLKPQDEDDEPTPYIQVSLRFDIMPPRIVMLTSTSRTRLDESSVESLDWADFENVDLIARGYNWEANGKTGVKAYLQSLFVTIQEDALERKYHINENPPQN